MQLEGIFSVGQIIHFCIIIFINLWLGGGVVEGEVTHGLSAALGNLL